MQKQFDDILKKRMDRKDFLKHVGLGVVVMTGLAGALKVLNPQAQQQASGTQQQSGGLAYGASAYGGHTASAQKS